MTSNQPERIPPKNASESEARDDFFSSFGIAGPDFFAVPDETKPASSSSPAFDLKTLAAFTVNLPHPLLEERSVNQEGLSNNNRLPLTAPDGWKVATTRTEAGSECWAQDAINRLGNVLFFLDSFLRAQNLHQEADLLKQVPIEPLTETLANGTQGGVGHWDPDSRAFRVDPHLVSDYFQLASTLLHETDHALHEIRPAQSVIEEVSIEIRAHSNTLTLLNRLPQFLGGLSAADDQVRQFWGNQVELIVAAQQVGLQSYAILNNFLFEVDAQFGDYLSNSRKLRGEAETVLQENIKLVEEIRHGEMVSSRTVTMAQNFLDQIPNLAPSISNQMHNFAAVSDRWQRSINQLSQAITHLEQLGGYGPA